MINWTLIKRGDFETSNVVIALSSILRYSIDDSKKYVSIKEKIEQVNNYLLIQKNRFEERLNYEIKMEERLFQYSMLKLLLQPIVENAVVHGIENRNRRGKAIIEAEVNIYTVEDGLEELELIKTITPDLIFVDIKMPNLNGIEFIQ